MLNFMFFRRGHVSKIAKAPLAHPLWNAGLSFEGYPLSNFSSQWDKKMLANTWLLADLIAVSSSST